MKWAEVLKCVVVFVLLSPYDSEQYEFMNRVATHKLLDDLPIFKALLDKFLTNEIMEMKELRAVYEAEMNSTEAFPNDNQVNARTCSAKAIFVGTMVTCKRILLNNACLCRSSAPNGGRT